jgi:hypothetical protein
MPRPDRTTLAPLDVACTMRDRRRPNASPRLNTSRRVQAACGGLPVLVAIPLPASAHSLGGLSTLPAPLTYFLAGVATLLIASFAVLTVRWPNARWQEAATIRPIKVPGW